MAANSANPPSRMSGGLGSTLAVGSYAGSSRGERMIDSKGDPKNGSAMEDPGSPTAADGLGNQQPDEEGIESCALATAPDCLAREPLDERELRIIRILYHGKGGAVCIWLSRGSGPDPGTLAECRSRETTSAER